MAIHTIRTTPSSVELVRLIVFDEDTYELYLERMVRLRPLSPSLAVAFLDTDA